MQLKTTKEDIFKQGSVENRIPIYTFENHDESYYIWRENGVKQKVLVHIDAHHDMWWLQTNAPITIANYICPALKEDMVKEIFWVVPGYTWKTWFAKRHLYSHLKKIISKYPDSSTPVESKKLITAKVLGKPLTICTLNSLPKINERVLLDIDIDFLAIPCTTYGKTDVHSKLPWCWTKELIDSLNKANVRADLITIAYSVEGGYTPLLWKYLGDELALRLKGFTLHDNITLKGLEYLTEAAILRYKGDLKRAENTYLKTAELISDHPAPSFHLADLYAKMHKFDLAKEAYKNAIQKDPSYKTIYNNSGLNFYHLRKFKESEKEFNKALSFDPNSACAYYGLGLIGLKKKQWFKANEYFRKSLVLDKCLVDGYERLGDIYLKLNMFEDAKVAYENFLKLTLKGYTSPITEIIKSKSEDLVLGKEHWRAYSKLAKIHSKNNHVDEAINCYKISIRGGYDNFSIRLCLAFQYLKKKLWRTAFKELIDSLKQIIFHMWTKTFY